MSKLSDEEIDQLRKLVPYADELAQEAQYEKSKSVVWRHWRSGVISLAVFVAAVVALWSQFKAVLVWVFR